MRTSPTVFVLIQRTGVLIRGAALCTLLTLLIVSCATAQRADGFLNDLPNLDVDPLECIGISIKKDVPIMKEIIHEPSVMQNRFMVVLRYREGGNEKENTPGLMPGYINISFVSEVEKTKDVPLVVHRRYCVVEVWRLYPKSDKKICYLWDIGDRGISMKLMLEDLTGEFLSERPISLSESEVSQLKAYYLKLMKTFVESLKEAPPTL